MAKPIKPTLVRAGLDAIKKYIDSVPYHLNLINSDLETNLLERDRCVLISQQCADIRKRLYAALRANDAIDQDVNRYLKETEPRK